MNYPSIHLPGSTRGSECGQNNGWMAFAIGMLAFIGGAAVGMLAGKKKMMMAAHGGMGPRMMSWKWHHHHGFGEPGCRLKHGMAEPAAPGAVGQPEEERNEGE